MEDSAYSQSRIAKNTIILCLRMLFTMGVTLYTSRVVLDVLGVEDYGIYNIVGGVVVLLSVISSTMRNATQRFITYELGQGDTDRVSDAFSMSMIAHLLISIAIIILGETIGLWYVLNRLIIPAGRETATVIIYHLSLLTMVLTLMRSPYDASVIAHEKMSFFAYMSIVDVSLKLAVVYLLNLANWDKLVFYTVLILATNIIIFVCYYIFCTNKLDTCKFRFIIKKEYFKKLFGFLGWSLLGASTTLGTQQAGNLIINRFMGVAVNAAYGVANQVNGAINSFVSNFQVAFTPQIVKLYSQKRYQEFYRLSNSAALFSYYILLIIALPLLINIDYVLNIWLVEVPRYAAIFCSLLIIYSLVDAIQAPLWIGINASGDIKAYEIWLSAILILNIPFSFYALKNGWEPYWVLAIRVILNLVTAIFRCIHVKIQLNYPIKQYLLNVIARAAIVSVIIALILLLVPIPSSYSSFWSFLVICFVSATVSCIIIFFVGFNQHEKRILRSIISSVFRDHKETVSQQ